MVKLLYIFFYNSEYLCFTDIPCQNSAKIIQYFLEKKFIFLLLLFLVTATILVFDLTQFHKSKTLESGYVPCTISEL